MYFSSLVSYYVVSFNFVNATLLFFVHLKLDNVMESPEMWHKDQWIHIG